MKGAVTVTNILNYVFNATAFPWTAITHLYVSLHTASPAAGNQTTSEATYTDYARVEVDRAATTGWAVAGAEVTNAAVVAFPEASAGTDHITHVAIGTLATTAGQVLYCGELTAHLDVSALITPQFAIGALKVTEV